MNKQRKVLITTTYNEMGIIIDTKVEEVTQTNLQPASTDTISRQAAIDAVNCVMVMKGVRSWKSIVSETVESAKGIIVDNIRQLPSIQPKRIRGRWTRDNACSECGCQPWFSGDIHNYNFCPNCGAEMGVTT